MTVAMQLRLAIGALVAALVAVIAAAFYVPAELNERANERFVEDAIPLQALVHDLLFETIRQEAAVERFLATGDESRLRVYYQATNAVNADLNRIQAYVPRHPQLSVLLPRAVVEIIEIRALLERQIAAVGTEQGRPTAPNVRIEEVEAAFARFRRTVTAMLATTRASVDVAVEEQRSTYRQLLVIVAGFGTVGLVSGLALLLLMPRRFGQLYEAEQRSRREAESRAEAARALEHVSDGVILTSADGVVEFWNPAAEKLTGIVPSAAIGRRLDRLLPGWERLALQPEADAGLGGAAIVPVFLGHERWLSVTSTDFGEGIVYAIRDVTEERALETMRSDFIATTSHELRTPLTSISGAARTLVHHGDALAERRQGELLDMIVSESDRLSRIVDQILLASRLEAGQVDVTPEPCDAVEITRAVIDAAQLRLPPEVRLTLDAQVPMPPVDCDPDRLRQVLGNVVDNAVKYSPKGGEVRVELRERGDALQFAVHDEGIGFDPSAAERIFERFERLDPNNTRGIGGTGLGLYICRELVQRMGGRIWADSRPGEGASFFFELPLAHDAVPAGYRQVGGEG